MWSAISHSWSEFSGGKIPFLPSVLSAKAKVHSAKLWENSHFDGDSSLDWIYSNLHPVFGEYWGIAAQTWSPPRNKSHWSYHDSSFLYFLARKPPRWSWLRCPFLTNQICWKEFAWKARHWSAREKSAYWSFSWVVTSWWRNFPPEWWHTWYSLSFI